MSSRSTPTPKRTGCPPANTLLPCHTSTTAHVTCTASSVWTAQRSQHLSHLSHTFFAVYRTHVQFICQLPILYSVTVTPKLNHYTNLLPFISINTIYFIYKLFSSRIPKMQTKSKMTVITTYMGTFGHTQTQHRGPVEGCTVIFACGLGLVA